MGIVTTAIKHRLSSAALEKKTIALMSTINFIGAKLAERRLVRAATDITGFGLTGHLALDVPGQRGFGLPPSGESSGDRL
jgi:selenophosphate synthase